MSSPSVRFHELLEGLQKVDSLSLRAQKFRTALKRYEKNYREAGKQDVANEIKQIVSDFDAHFYDLLDWK